MKVKSESEVAQLCPTLSDPMNCSLTVSSVHGIFQARVLEWGAIAFSESHLSQKQYTQLLLTCFMSIFFLKCITVFLHVHDKKKINPRMQSRGKE